MARFAEWLVLESFLNGLETEMLMERAALETLSMVARAIRESEEDDEDDGSPAVLADPFAGDEDAKPIEQDPEVDRILQNPVKDAAPAGEGGYSDPEKHSESLKKIASSLKVLRADAIRKRAEKVKEVARLADSGADLEAVPVLAELGYFGKTDGEGQNDTMRKMNYYLGGEFRKEVIAKSGGRLDQKAKDAIKNKENEFHDKLMETLNSAANEDGNDPPEGRFPSQSEVNHANQDFMESLNKVLGNRFVSLAAKNQSRAGLGKGRVGHQQYEAEDLANDMALGLLKHFQTRKWKGSGEERMLLPWTSNEDILESDPRDLIAHLMKTAKNQTKKTMAKASPPPKFSVPNGSAKASLIRKDLDNRDFGFYLAYIRAAQDRPLRSDDPDGKDRDPNEEIVSAGDKRDRMRRSIMQDIEMEVVHNNTPGMSLDPRYIKDTLETYLRTKLVPEYRQVVHASQIAGEDESSEDEILSGMSHSQHSDDEFDPRTANPMDSARTDDLDDGEDSESPPDTARPVRQDQVVLNLFRQVVDELSAKGGVYPARAFALCLKYGIKCHITKVQGRTKGGQPTTTVASVRVADDAAINIPQGTNFNFDSASNCTGQFTKIGMANINVSRRWGFMPVTGQPSGLTPISPSQAGELLAGNPSGIGAIPYLCQKLREMGVRR